MILSDHYSDLLFDFILPKSLIPSNSCALTIDNNLSLLYLPENNAIRFPLSQYRYLYLPALYTQVPFTSETTVLPYSALERSGIANITRPPLSLSGLGTIIAVIDSGIDYTLPAFRNPDGTSRILAIWDQTITGSPPADLPYGSLYTKTQIDAALRSPSPRDLVPTYDSGSRHGTRLAAIAAGSDSAEEQYRGAAPLSSLVIVKLKPAKKYLMDYYAIKNDAPCYEESDLINALKFVAGFHVPLSTPLSVLVGVGSNFGDHNGTSFLENYMDRLCTLPGFTIAVPAGNEANKRHHYRGTFTENTNQPQIIELDVAENNSGFLLQFFGSITNRFSLSLKSPLGEEIKRISYDLERSTRYSFLYDRTTIDTDSLVSDPLSAEEAIYLRFQNPTPGLWRISVYPEQISSDAVYDFWLPTEGMLSSDVSFTVPDSYVTLCAPSMAANCLCAASYGDSERIHPPYSGRGFTRNGLIKPDIAAPGNGFSSIDNPLGGTAGSAALVCGASALFMEWAIIEKRYPFFTGVQIRNLFRRSATRLPDETYPNPDNGYGFLNPEGMIQSL